MPSGAGGASRLGRVPRCEVCGLLTATGVVSVFRWWRVAVLGSSAGVAAVNIELEDILPGGFSREIGTG